MYMYSTTVLCAVYTSIKMKWDVGMMPARSCRYEKAPHVGMRAYNNLLQPQKPRCRDLVVEDCCMLSTLPVVPSCIYSFGMVSSLHPTSAFFTNEDLVLTVYRQLRIHVLGACVAKIQDRARGLHIPVRVLYGREL